MGPKLHFPAARKIMPVLSNILRIEKGKIIQQKEEKSSAADL